MERDRSVALRVFGQQNPVTLSPNHRGKEAI